MNRKALAIKAAQVYERNPKVEAVMLAGSVSRNWNDAFSDIELFVLWREEPADRDRKSPIDELNGHIIDYHPYEDEEWSETYLAEGVKLEISNFLTQTIANIIHDVTRHYDTNPDKQCIAAAVHHGIPLVGTRIIDRLKEKVSEYPEGLSEAMVLENLDLGNRWNNREALLHRKDWLMLYDTMISVQRKLMGVLFGLNRLYVHHPAFKWQKLSLQAMTITPPNITERFESVLLGPPGEGLRELEAMIQDIFVLSQQKFPHLDLSAYIEKSRFVRPKQ
ncbi:DUF4037 domain-containing protein [Paenactinomyces guangxiensis]|uniref:DUF4037 domain-containing protein n=1 Tax=Paenactinomyces guangxiensis TaxID=1490290 RepID=A0A7W1WNY7_9BACL|nr:DUF4037 domain-containing protein [Paenactinomyces guangxiensis]MBA4493371.1 DUF4037 domain-containing protein [Paenactinomyces guangxiensis]MBH8590461.1 DUF4037 domain-containing protein [Paenactinomyces guangxiensis]